MHELKTLLESELTMREKILASEIIQNDKIDASIFTTEEVVDSVIFLIEKMNFCFRFFSERIEFTKNNNTSTPKDKTLVSQPVSFLHIDVCIFLIYYKFDYNFINILYNKYIYINTQKANSTKYLNLLNLRELARLTQYLDLTEVANSNGDLKKLTYLDSISWILSHISHQESKIKSLGLGETYKQVRKKPRKRSDAENTLNYLKDKIVNYHESIDAKSYFPEDWWRRGIITTRSIIKYLSLEEVRDAIDWFFDNDYWKSKIDSMKMIEKHYNKFSSSRTRKNEGLLSSKSMMRL